jgi:hypothetical protein
MAFINLPPNLHDMFYGINDRLAKLETQPNQAMYTAVSASASAAQGRAEAAQAYAVGIQAQNAAAQSLIQAQAAYALGSQSIIKSANTITNAQNQLTSINGNGISVYAGSSTTGARVILNSAGLAGYNSSNVATFAINAATGAVSTNGAIFTSSTITGGSLNIAGKCTINTDGLLVATGATITGTLTSSNATITGGSLTVGSTFQVNSSGVLTATAGNIGGWSIGSSTLSSGTGAVMNATTGNIAGNNVTAFTSFFGGGMNVTSGVFDMVGRIQTSGAISSGGNFTCNGSDAAFPNIPSTTSVANMRWGTTGGGRLFWNSASSARFKENIVDIFTVEELNPKKLLQLPVRAFTYKEGHLSKTDDRSEIMVPGFIAEEVDEIYTIAADYELGQPNNVNDRFMIPGMLALIQDQEKRITQLEGK